MFNPIAQSAESLDPFPPQLTEPTPPRIDLDLDLTKVNVDMFAEAFRVENSMLNWGLKQLLRGPARRAAAIGQRYESLIAQHGSVKEASEWLANRLARSWQATGLENIPAEGPLLFAANHPGMGDAISIYATSPRRDIHTFVKVRTMLSALPNFVKTCVVMDEANPRGALRETMTLLKQQKSVLLFPRGEMESDPCVYQKEAVASLDHWSPSLELLVRRVPNLAIVPVAVSGVISGRAMGHPLTKIYRSPASRDYMAATLQLIAPGRFEIDVNVQYGEPLTGKRATLTAVQAQMRAMLGGTDG